MSNKGADMITIKLKDVDRFCNWERFCEITGTSYYACNDGYGDSDIYITEEQCLDLGIIKEQT